MKILPLLIQFIERAFGTDKTANSPARTKKELETWYRQKTINDAVALNLPDGIFRIVFYNSQYSHREPEKQIDPFEVFSSSPHSEVEDWIARSKNLMSSNYEVGDALVGKYKNYEVVQDQFIRSNPGFSKGTYAHAIHLGASKAVH